MSPSKFEMIKALEAQGDIYRACALVDEQISGGDVSSELVFLASSCYSKMSKSEVALSKLYNLLLLKGIPEGSTKEWINYSIALVHLRANNLRATLSVCNSMLSAGCSFPEIHDAVAQVRFRSGDIDGFIVSLERASLDKDDHRRAWGFYNAANLLLSVGQYKLARNYVKRALAIESDPFFNQLDGIIKVVSPEVTAEKWEIFPPILEGMAFVTVVFNEEINLLKLQARSIARFMKFDDTLRIYIIVNEPGIEETMARLRAEVLSEYGKFQSLVSIISIKELCDFKSGSPGWRTQQLGKLKSAKIVAEDVMVILDSKNHFIREADLTDFYSVSTGCKSFLEGNEKNFAMQAAKIYSYFGLSMEDLLGIRLTTITPFVVPRFIILDMLQFVESREMTSFSEFFMNKGEFLTEFLAISAYCQMRFGALGVIYSIKKPPVLGIWEATLKFPFGVQQDIAKAAQDDLFKMFSVHRKASSLLSRDQRLYLREFWKDLELIFDYEAVDLFLS